MSMYENRLGVDLSTPAPHYISPNSQEITDMATKIGVKTPYEAIIRDMAHIASGGQFKNATELQQEMSKSAMNKAIQEAYAYEESKSWIEQRAASILEAEIIFNDQVRNFIESLEINRVPGNAPLEKAMTVMKMLEEQSKSGKPMDSKDINEGLKLFQSLSDEDKELLDYKRKDGNDANDLTDFMSNMKEIIMISRHLEKVSALHVYRFTEITPDTEGEEVRYRPMKVLDEMHQMRSSEWVLPDFFRTYRHITQQTMVREHIVRAEKKQLIYMLVDCSASMGQGDRFKFAIGILINRIQAVFRGDAEMWFSWFHTSVEEENHIHNKETAKRIVNEAIRNSCPGGGTSIDLALDTGTKRIHELMAKEPLHRPELIIVSDGDDTVESSKADLKGIRLHSFTCQGKNIQLNKLARSTGGVGMHLDWNIIRR